THHSSSSSSSSSLHSNVTRGSAVSPFALSQRPAPGTAHGLPGEGSHGPPWFEPPPPVPRCRGERVVTNTGATPATGKDLDAWTSTHSPRDESTRSGAHHVSTSPAPTRKTSPQECVKSFQSAAVNTKSSAPERRRRRTGCSARPAPAPPLVQSGAVHRVAVSRGDAACKPAESLASTGRSVRHGRRRAKTPPALQSPKSRASREAELLPGCRSCLSGN
ncbi:unnamed protein product, partial [Pleuronectes platessa]